VTPVDEWDWLNELVDRSEAVIDRPDEVNQLALALMGTISFSARQRVATEHIFEYVRSVQLRDHSSDHTERSRLDVALASCDATAPT
jgi:hypothetical protein